MSYEVIKADLRKDKATILDFWNRHNEKQLDNKFSWIYLANPDGMASTWLLKHIDSGHIVGMASVFPRKFRYRETYMTAGIQGDFFIQTEHRTFGPALMLIRAIINSLDDLGYDFLIAFPNKKAEPIFGRAGYQLLGVTKKYIRLFDLKRLLAEKTPIPGPLLSVISPISNQLLKLAYPDTWVFNLGRFRTAISSSLDIDFHHISESYHQNSFTTSKNLEYLKWKYENDPDDENQFFTITDSSDRVVGCIVFCIESDNQVQIREILHTQDPDTQAALLSLFYKQMRSTGCEYAYAQIYEESGILATTNNLDLTVSDQGRKIVIATNPNKESASLLNELLHSSHFNLFGSDEDS